MKFKLTRLSRQYVAALRKHLKHGPRGSLQPADGLGRRAVAIGLETLDLARIHEQALVRLVSPRYSAGTRDGLIKRAELFFVEAITPIEETYRAMRKANVHLSRANRTLRQRTVELAAANRQLKREIARRKAVEKSLRTSEQHHSRLLEQSRRQQEQLRQLARQILSALEDERRKISRELHDEIAQTLTGINVHLATLNKEAKVNARGLTKKIARTQRLVETSVNIVHRFARELRPTVLDDLGLIPALHSFMKEFTKRTGIHIHFTAVTGVERLDSVKRTVLYRVAQAALTNAAQHANAGRVTVRIRKIPGAIRMEIKDDGKGFEVERVLFAKRHKRLGLLGARERVEMVGGSFAVVSAPGQGTLIRAEIPFNHGAKV
ncbi:MAG TPA: ATP-binding protein [Verrucomicrobiae bacterium]|nr:ATP-binding protein [Verrucomicrobiae bacterium]